MSEKQQTQTQHKFRHPELIQALDRRFATLQLALNDLAKDASTLIQYIVELEKANTELMVQNANLKADKETENGKVKVETEKTKVGNST